MPHNTDATGEDDDRGEQKRLAAEQIAQPPENRNRDNRRQHVRRRDPCVQVEALQFRDDARQRGADDGLVERDQHRDERDAEHRQQRFAKWQQLPAWIVRSSAGSHGGLDSRLSTVSGDGGAKYADNDEW